MRNKKLNPPRRKLYIFLSLPFKIFKSIHPNFWSGRNKPKLSRLYAGHVAISLEKLQKKTTMRPTLHTSSLRDVITARRWRSVAVFFYYDQICMRAMAEYANVPGPCYLIYCYFYLILGIITRTVSVWVRFIFYYADTRGFRFALLSFRSFWLLCEDGGDERWSLQARVCYYLCLTDVPWNTLHLVCKRGITMHIVVLWELFYCYFVDVVVFYCLFEIIMYNCVVSLLLSTNIHNRVNKLLKTLGFEINDLVVTVPLHYGAP